MLIRALTSDDIPAAAALLRRAAHAFILTESSPQDAASFLAGQDAQAMRGFLAQGYAYHLAELGGVLAGFIALRERSHVYSLYVEPRFHRRGIARRLWQTARDAALGPGHPGVFTVNASIHALPFYAAQGFVASAPAQAGIVRYHPMRLAVASAPADPVLVGPA